MTHEQRAIVEWELTKAMMIFSESNSKTKGKAYAKEYFEKFCKDNNIDQAEAFLVVEEILSKKTNETFSYTDMIDFLRKEFFKSKEQEER